MRTATFLALLTLLGAAAALLPVRQAAGQGQIDAQPVYRCIGPDGSVMFSGTPCYADHLAQGTVTPADTVNTSLPGHLCPLDPDALRTRVGEAFLTHDINRLAGLMLWDGYSRRGALARIQSLTGVMRHGIAGIELTGLAAETAEPASASTTLAQSMDEATALQPTRLAITLDDGSNLDFVIERDHGCWWLLP